MNKSSIREIASRAFNYGFSTEKIDDIEILNLKFKRWFEETFEEIFNNNETEETMKITKETKIGDIIPEGYDLDTIKEVYNGSISIGEVGVGNITIPIKKKEEKNFEWYIEKYFETNFMFFIRDEYEKPMKEKLLDGYFSVIDFEIRIGLLKFIYEDISKNSNIKIGWLYTLELVQNYTPNKTIPKIMDICPKEFLDSLFE